MSDYIEKVKQGMTAHFAELLDGWIEHSACHAADFAESPIEIALKVAYVNYLHVETIHGSPYGGDAEIHESFGGGTTLADAMRILPPSDRFNQTDYVLQQVPIDKYRVDLLICRIVGMQVSRIRDDEPIISQIVLVECDGHDYHDRTKEQAARDKSRDRAIQTAGYPILRFTGSEIHQDPYGCAKQISVFLDERISQKIIEDRARRKGNTSS